MITSLFFYRAFNCRMWLKTQDVVSKVTKDSYSYNILFYCQMNAEHYWYILT